MFHVILHIREEKPLLGRPEYPGSNICFMYYKPWFRLLSYVTLYLI